MLDDTNVTGDVTFTVGLSSPSGTAQLMAPSVETVTIQDADAGFSFTNSAMTVLRTAGSAIITVVCSNPNTEPLSVNYATADGTALAGQDYTAVSGTLVFDNGIATNTFTVPIINNSLMGSRAFTVSLSNPTAPGQLVAPTTLTVTIVDGVAAFAFSNTTYSVDKSGVSAAITVLRTGYHQQHGLGGLFGDRWHGGGGFELHAGERDIGLQQRHDQPDVLCAGR